MLHVFPESVTAIQHQKSGQDISAAMASTKPAVCCRHAVMVLLFFMLAATSAPRRTIAQENAGKPVRESFVPAEELDSIFERSPAGVMLPREQFQELLKAAQQAQAADQKKPDDIVVRSATYKVQQADQHALIELQINFEQFANRWVATTIPIGNLSVESANIDGQAASIGHNKNAPQSLILCHREPGRFTLVLTLSTPLGIVGSDRIAAFRIISNSASSITVSCPKDRILQVNELRLDRPAPIDQTTEYSFPTGGTDSITLKWTTPQQTLKTQSLVFVKSNVQILLSSDNVRWKSDSRVTVFGDSINQLVARVPASLEVTNIESTGLESWSLEDDPELNGYARVLLSYRQPFTEDRLVNVSAVAALATDGTSKLPALEFINVTAHTGRLFVNHEDQLRLLANVGGGVRQLGAESRTQGTAAAEVFDFCMQDYQLSVAIKPRDRELFAEMNSELKITDSLCNFECNTTIESLNAPLFELHLSLPAGWAIHKITDHSGTVLQWRSGEVDNVIVVEPASQVLANGLFNFITTLTRTIEDPTTPQEFALPSLVATDTLLVGGTYQISSASDLTIAPLEISGLSAIGDNAGTLLYETQGKDFSGTLSVVRKPVRLSSRSVLKSWMDARQISVDATVTVDILNGTTRTLQLLASESLGSELRFDVASISEVPGIPGQNVPDRVAIVEQTIGQLSNGQRSIQLTFDKRFSGAMTLKAFVQQPRSDDTKLIAPFIKVVDAVRQHGLVSFEAHPDQQLEASVADVAASGLTLADSDLVDPPADTSGRRIALVYRFIQPDYRLSIEETRFKTQSVPSAVCENIANVSVLSETGTIQRACRVQFRSAGVQTLRFALPDLDNSFLWSTVLNGEAIEVRRDGDDYLVAIPPNSESSAHVLEVLFESNNDETNALGATTQQSLKLSIDTDHGQAAAIDILEQTWQISYPKSALLVGQAGGFHPQEKLDKPGILQTLTSLAFLPTLETAIGQLVFIGLLLLALLVGLSLIARQRWKTLGGVFLSGLIVMTLLLPSVQQSREAARRASRNDAGPDYTEDADAESGTADAVALGINISGGTNMHFGTEREEAGELMEDARYNRAPTDSPFPAPPLPDMDTDGLGGYAEGLPMGAADPFSQLPGNPPAQPDGNRYQVEDLNVNNAITGTAVAPQQASDPNDFYIYRDGNSPALNGVDPFSRQARTGSARLSVRADVAQPDDYRSMQFRSIGGSSAAGTLQVIVQERSRLNALRLMAASAVVLLCLWVNAQSAVRKTSLAMTLILATGGAVPLVPNQWQSLVDGLGLGTGVGICLWIFSYIVCWISKLLTCCCHNGHRQSLKQHVSTTVAIAAFAWAASTGGSIIAQEVNNSPVRPDVVLPYDSGQSELLAERVFLPKEEFLKLYRLANPDEFNDKNAAAQDRVVAAFYKSSEQTQIKESQWSQRFTARYVIQSYSDHAVNIILPIGEVAVQSATLNDSAAILVAEPNSGNAAVQPQIDIKQQSNQNVQQQTQSLLPPQTEKNPAVKPSGHFSVRIPNKGLHLVDIVFDVPATVENSVGQLRLPVHPVSSGTLAFELQQDDVDVQVNGRSNTFRRNGKELIIPIATSNELKIEWRPSTSRASTNVIYHSTVNSALTLSDAGLTVQASIFLNCRQGQIAETEVSLPSNYAVQSVSGNDIAGWKVNEASPGTLTIQFKQPIEGETNANLVLFRNQTFSTDNTKLDVPVLAIAGASRDSGNITILAGRELEVRVDSLSGVAQMNAAESNLPMGVDDSLRRVLAWRYTRHPAAISVRAFRTVDRMQIKMLSGVQLESQRQLWTTLVTATISGAPRRRLEIVVPEDFVALDVSANDLADWYYTNREDDDSKTKILNIQFNTTRQGTINAVIQAQSGRSNATTESRITSPIVMDADEAVSNISVWLDAASKIASTSADTWKRTGSETAIDPRVLQLQSDAPDISFVSNSTSPQSIVLTLMQATPSLIPESVSVTNVTETSIELTQTMKWQIAGAATRELTFSLPASLSDVFDFRIPGLRQLQKKTVGERVEFLVHLQQPVSEQFFILGTATLPLPQSRQIVAMPPEFPGHEAKASHFWVIVNQSSGLLQALDVETDGDDVAATDIRTKLPEGLLQQSVAIRRLKTDQPNSAWQLKYAERQQVAPAVVALAAHTTILSKDGTWRSIHKLQVRNESRQFLPFSLPQDSRILFCRVAGNPTRVASRDQDGKPLYLIPIPQSGQSCLPFDLEFAITGTMPSVPGDLAGKSLSIPSPTFPEFRDFPEFGITVSRNTWSVYVPQEWRASILTDPRKTNVIEASVQDFEDAILLSTVDNLKSMVNSARSDSANLFGNDSKWLDRLNQQQQVLEALSGNTAQSEELRRSSLQEFEALKDIQAGNTAIESQSSQQVDSYQYFDNGTATNRYLDRQEILQNGFNSSNSLQLIQSNIGSGGQLGQKLDTFEKFRFTLPELADKQQQPAGHELSNAGDKGKQDTSKQKNEDSRNWQPGTNAPRSQLLERRKSTGPRPAAPAKKEAPNERQLREQQTQTHPQFAPDEFTRVRRSGTLNAAEEAQSQIEGMNGPAAQVQTLNALQGDFQVVGVDPQGVLSLDFQIPEDGTRHNFVRTGGNASLTLTVRSKQAVDYSLAVVWAAACAIAAVFVMRSAAKGGRSLLLQILVLAAIVGITGGLCLPSPIRTVSLLLFIAATIAIYFMLTLQNYSSRNDAVKSPS